MPQLDGQTALVTGGNSGIGYAIAKRFAAEGAQVFITGRNAHKLDDAARNIAGNVRAIAADLTIENDLHHLFDTIRSTAGALNILVNSAGISEPASLTATDSGQFDRQFGLNVRATLLVAKQSLQLMDNGGSIVLIGSIAGTTGMPGYGVYGASKAAVRALARTWANELAARNIRVNVLSPGPIQTERFELFIDDDMLKHIASSVPLQRIGQPEEVASAALFLASNESSFITGVELDIDGGLSQV